MTDLDRAGTNALQRLFSKHALPELSFDHWTAEYAREVWEMTSFLTKADTVEGFVTAGMDPRDELLTVLDRMDVFDPDPELQRWKPPGSW